MWRHQQEYNILYLSLLNLHIISPFPVRCLFFFIAANKWRNVNLKSPQLGNVGRRVGAQGAAVILPCDLSDPDLQLLVKAPPCTVRLSLCVCIVSSEGHGFSVQKKPKKLLCMVEAFSDLKSVAANHQQHRPLQLKDLSSFYDSSKINCSLLLSMDLKFKEIHIRVWKRNLNHPLEMRYWSSNIALPEIVITL